MFGLESKNKILCCMDDIKSCARATGYAVSDLQNKEIFGVLVERMKIEKNGSNPTVLFGNNAISLLEAVPLKREPTPIEMLEWNAKTHLIAYTYSPEGTLAILKTYVPCSHGISDKNLESLLEIWDRRVGIFKERAQGLFK
jgi:hypothetical protein